MIQVNQSDAEDRRLSAAAMTSRVSKFALKGGEQVRHIDNDNENLL